MKNYAMHVYRSPFSDIEIPEIPLPEMVFQRVDEHPDKPALIEGMTGHTLTYAQLREQARAFAAGLAARGFRKGDALAIYSPNLPEYAVVFYGVAIAGGITTTVNPLYTVDELAHQLEDAGARFLVTFPLLLENARAAAERAGVEEVIVIGEADGATPMAELLRHGTEPPAADINPREDLVVLPYSSGTTGRPKGVMLTHYNLVANIAQTMTVEQFEDDEVLIGILPFYHIYGMTVIMSMALYAGATVVTMPRFDLEQFLELLQRYRITTAFLVPPIILALAKHPLVDQYDLSSLRYVNSGAAPLPEPVARQCAERLNVIVRQGYGMTETSPVTHFTPRGFPIKLSSVGVAVPNTEFRIVDVATHEDVPEGETGELWIRGPQVMKGYWKNPQATRDTLDEEGWLHTGDVARVDQDGYLYIVDRVKELIKYKGYQVAPAELEEILQGHPAVADVAVVPSPDEEAGEVPKAYVVLKPGVQATAEELMAYVAERVAPYKKIRRVEFVDQIPKTLSGKILRRELVRREREIAGMS